ncbi:MULTISPECIES: helix-turn-helix domain-containing protein [unclassified Halorhabdus]|uniref:MarR family transcriptional regulator n=1 Tax=unclassified Halorhabdus TaxID=2621901 RepID=UPI0023D9B5CE|nr:MULTISPECIES: helix-turn-helix domain-containing protein [unclassified Halorhabdus]WEL16612.1 Transcriptional regulator, TrmB family [Halorhabdus sp. SVX81]WEL20492.1 Transcriptional regulator, TrmB family [Halorhabdus sp. BNX81]
MPINIKRFEESPPGELRAGGPTNAEAILSFLASSPEQAYTPKEIHEATDVKRGSVGVVLSRLEERGLVRHRGDYWAITEEADVEKTLSAMSTARAASDRLGAEDPDEWGPGVDSDDE